MGTPELAAVFVAAGIVAVFIGLGLTALISRRLPAPESSTSGHLDAGRVVLVVGLAALLLGAADYVFLVFTT